VAQFKDLADRRGLELTTTLDPRLAAPDVELYADLEKLDRVLFNLLSNAHKFVRSGSIEVATELTPTALRLRVTDTGIGIREDQLPHVFDRFRQADGSASREYAGTGLGLALVAEIAKLHGGNVQAFSRYGHGSTFIVELPLGRAHLDPACIIEGAPLARQPGAGTVLELNEGADGMGDDTEALNAEMLAQGPSRRATILYVDDNRDLRQYIRDLLAPTYRVLLAVDGADGLAKARAHKPDLVLSDLMMPRMTGTDFCAALRKDVELAATPFVLLTARSTIESKVEGLEDGADDYLSKPFSPAELLARVKNLITIREQHIALKRELLAAREIQRALLPPERLSLPGASLHILFRPCAELSGDFFDVVRAEDEVVFYLADVTSHGTAAAQVTYLVREAVRASLEEARAAGAASPGALMPRLRRRYASYGLPLDVGLQLGRLDLRTRELSLMRANAPSALRIRGARFEMCSAPVVPALSATLAPGEPATEEPSLTFRLEAGEQLFLFSDGAYEFDAGGRPFGMKRLVNLLVEQAARGEDDRSMDEVWSRMRSVAKDGQFLDDITMIRLSVDGEAGRA
jgi:CheY-like chemotaxis protein